MGETRLVIGNEMFGMKRIEPAVHQVVLTGIIVTSTNLGLALSVVV